MAEVTKEKLFEVEGAIVSLGTLPEFKVAYALQRNLARIKPELDSLRETVKDIGEFNSNLRRMSSKEQLDFMGKEENILKKSILQKKDDEFQEQIKTEKVEIEFYRIKLSYISNLDSSVKNKFTQTILNALLGNIIEDDLKEADIFSTQNK